MVFYCFDRDTHVKSGLNDLKFDYYMLGQDFGGGAGECGQVLCGILSNSIYCLKEFCKAKTSHTEALAWLEQYRTQSRGILVYDSANAAMATDAINKEWRLIKSIKDLEGSFTILNDLFSQNRLFIDQSCSILIKQIESASRDPNGLVKKLNGWDVLDAFRYATCAIELKEDKIYKEETKRAAFSYIG